MCLVTRQIKPRITKKDLVVRKIVRVNHDESITSFCRSSFIWIKGKLETTELGISKRIPRNCCVHDDPQSEYYKEGNKQRNRKLTVVSQGFHAVVDPNYNCNLSGYNIRKFLIPAGSTIYKDATGLIVSNKMMML